MAFYRSELSNYDFVELDDESVSKIKNSNSLETVPMLTPKLSEAIFLRSASPVAPEPKSSKRELSIATGIVVTFDAKSGSIEGRDSQIYCGQLLEAGKNDTQVAVKVYHSDSTSRLGAEKEVKISQLTDGRLEFAKLIHYFKDEAIAVWEWIPFGSLDRCARKWQNTDITGIIISIAKSVAFLHSQKIVHHDLKPHNILFSPDRVILIDFGDAKLDCLEELSVEEGVGLGTLAYTAPELLSRNTISYNPYAADVYSFGVVAFYLLNRGQIDPWSAFLPSRAVQMILYAQKGFFAGGFNPELPANNQISEIIANCLALDPSKRPSMSQVVELLDQIK